MTIHFGDGTSIATLPTFSDQDALVKAEKTRRNSDFTTTSTSYQTAIEVTINPVTTNSDILVIAVGGATGRRSGNSSGQQASAYTNIFRGNSTVGKEQFHNKGNPTFTTPLGQAYIDTTNHSGNNVTYRLKLTRSGGGNNTSVTVEQGASLMAIEIIT